MEHFGISNACLLLGKRDSRFFNSLSFVFVLGCFPGRAYHHTRNKVIYKFFTRDFGKGVLQLFNTCYYQVKTPQPRSQGFSLGGVKGKAPGTRLKIPKIDTRHVNEGKLSSNFMKGNKSSQE